MTGHRPLSLRAFYVFIYATFVGLIMMPLGAALYLSFTGADGLGFSAYHAVLGDARQWTLLKNSLLVALGVAAGGALLGVIAAVCTEYLRAYGAGALRYALATPLLIPPYVAGVAWIEVFGANGLTQRILGTPLLNLYSIQGVVWSLSLSYFPLAALATAIALRRLDPRLEEAGLLAGSRLRALTRIVLPLAAPYVVTGALAVFVLALVNFSLPSLLQVNVYAVEIFTQFSAFYDSPAAIAQTVPIIACGLGALALWRWWARPRQVWLRGRRSVTARAPRSSVWRAVASVVGWALAAVSVGAPLAVLLWRSLPVRSYRDAFITAREEIGVTVWSAALTATLITALAFALACLRRRGSPLRAIHSLALAAFLLTGPALGVALIFIWNRSGWMGAVYDSAIILVLACGARFLFVGERALSAAVMEIPRGYEEAAEVAGVSWTRQMVFLHAPLVAPAMAGAWGLSFVLCASELDATALVYPPGATPLPMRIFSLMHYGPSATVAALCVLIVALTLGTAACMVWLYHWTGKRAHAGR